MVGFSVALANITYQALDSFSLRFRLGPEILCAKSHHMGQPLHGRDHRLDQMVQVSNYFIGDASGLKGEPEHGIFHLIQDFVLLP